MRNRMSGFLTVLLATIVIFGAVPAIKAQPPAPAMWIEPPTLNFNTVSTHVGDKFNVTAWASAASDVFAWQCSSDFDPTQLAVVRAGYTGPTGSLWFSGHSTVASPIVIDSTGGNVLAGEALLSSDVVHASSGSLLWIEFQILIAPAPGNTLTSLIDPNNPDSKLLDTNVQRIRGVTLDHATYSYTAIASNLYVSITPSSGSVAVNQPLLFTSNVIGGTPPYSFQWFLNGAPVPGATSSSWTFSSATSGTYAVYLHVTDNLGVTADSNNAFVTVHPAYWTIGVKTGDWIKLEFTVSVPSPGANPEWIKLEFLSVAGSQASVDEIMHMSDGTETHYTTNGDIMAGDLGFVIPANMMAGDSIALDGMGTILIAGETTRTYAGASRTVVWTNVEVMSMQFTYYWDKQTGIIVEGNETSTSPPVTVSFKAVETNMWSPAVPVVLNIEPNCLNLRSKGRWITATIELPEGYDASDVDTSSLLLNSTVPAEQSSSSKAHSLTVKFDRAAVSGLILSRGLMRGNVTLTVNGRFADGTMFEGSDTIRVRLPGDVNMDGRVDVSDLAIVSKVFSSHKGRPNWNPLADQNEDNRVDVTDLAIVCQNFGHVYK